MVKHPDDKHQEKHPAKEHHAEEKSPPAPQVVKYERPPPKEGMVRVRMQKLTNEVNHGTTRYPVGDDGIVDLPPEAAQHVIRQGGAVLVSPPPPPAEGTLKVKHVSDPKTIVSQGDQILYPDNKGEIEIPLSVLEDVTPHGFLPV